MIQKRPRQRAYDSVGGATEYGWIGDNNKEMRARIVQRAKWRIEAKAKEGEGATTDDNA